ncbi:MAG: hypothetical protein ACRC1J_01825, partial [Sandaracinobacteroides sp.]
FRSAPALDRVSAADEAQARLAGFVAADVVLSTGGRGAVVEGRDGSIALLLPLGDGWITRRLSPGAVRCTDGRFTAFLGEPMLNEAHLTLTGCPPWLRAQK